MGRLFDAVSSLAGVCHRVAYEAEAAMRFEGLARERRPTAHRGVRVRRWTIDLVADPAPLLGRRRPTSPSGVPAATVAARFHLAVADLVVAVALRLRAEDRDQHRRARPAGCSSTSCSPEACVRRLEQEGFVVLRHRQVPPSDAGLPWASW